MRVIALKERPHPDAQLPVTDVDGLRVTDQAKWREPVAPPDTFTWLPGPRLLYTGAIDSRLDLDGVTAVSAAFLRASPVFASKHGDEAVIRRLAELKAIRSVADVCLAEDADGFVAQVRAALDARPTSEPDRLRFVAENSWTRSFEDLLDVALKPLLSGRTLPDGRSLPPTPA